MTGCSFPNLERIVAELLVQGEGKYVTGPLEKNAGDLINIVELGQVILGVYKLRVWDFEQAFVHVAVGLGYSGMIAGVKVDVVSHMRVLLLVCRMLYGHILCSDNHFLFYSGCTSASVLQQLIMDDLILIVDGQAVAMGDVRSGARHNSIFLFSGIFC